MHTNSSAAPDQNEGNADALSDILQDFRLSGVSYSRCQFRHPWGVELAAEPLLRFHFVSEGTCWFHTEAEGWQELGPGSIVLLPQGSAHRLASAPAIAGDTRATCQVTEYGGNVCQMVQPGDGAMSTIFTGSMALGSYALHPLVGLMPAVIKGCDVATLDPLVNPLIAAMALEASQPDMGSATILSRMADLLTARLIRCWVTHHTGATTGWLAAIRDPHIGRVLVAIHRQPGHNWTLANLAAVAGQSRSVFAERFAAVLGEGAARYLARVRMQLAHEWLGRNGMTTAAVAAELGYESEASFARAFKRVTSQSPGMVRRSNSGRNAIELGL